MMGETLAVLGAAVTLAVLYRLHKRDVTSN